MLVAWIQLKSISPGTAAQWDLDIWDAILDINTFCICLHRYISAENLFGFNSLPTRKHNPGFAEWVKQSVDSMSPEMGEQLIKYYNSSIQTF